MADGSVDGRGSAPPRRALFDIEREKRWRVWLLFALLLALTFVTVWVACLIVVGIGYLVVPPLGPPSWLFSLVGVAAVLGARRWSSRSSTGGSLRSALATG